MKQKRTPLIEAMRRYVDDGAIAFHTPGHKQGKGIDTSFADLVTPLGLKMEVSLMEELDDLFEPQTCLKEAQDLAAALYEVDATFFMVNGTTGAIQIMLLAALQPGDQVLMPRNVHRSVLGALVLGGLQPVFIEPVFDARLGIEMALEPAAVAKALAANPAVKAVLLVYPTYYGIASDIQKIAELVHAQGKLLLVDNAHGPHLKFSQQLPLDAMQGGADMAAQSTHKILSSLTQTSMLQVCKKRVSLEKVKQLNGILQSTSPNYLLLASLDAARAQMAQQGMELMARTVQLAQWLRQAINQLASLYCPGEEMVGQPGCYAIDSTKLIVNVRALGMTGYAAEAILRHQYKIQCELSDMYNVLFIISLADTMTEAKQLLAALRGLLKHRQAGRTVDVTPLPPLPQQVLGPREAAFAAATAVPLAQSAHRTCAETVTFYPPGIPLLYPGERITSEIISYIKQGQAAGAKIVGPADASLKQIKVLQG